MSYDFMTHTISYSDLKDIKISWDRYKHNKLNPKDYSSYAFGRYFEDLLFDRNLDNYVYGDGRTKEIKDAKKDGKTHIKPDEVELGQKMLESVKNSPFSFWLNEPYQEQVKLQTSINGVECKGFLDILIDDRIIDVKTIDDIKNIDYHVKNYGYYLQAAMYQQLVLKTKGVQLPYYFFFIEKSNNHSVVLCELDQDYIDAGCSELYDLLDLVKEYRELESLGEYTGINKTIIYKPKWM